MPLVVGLVEAADELGLRLAVVEPEPVDDLLGRRQALGGGVDRLLAVEVDELDDGHGLLDRRALGRGQVDLGADLRLGLGRGRVGGLGRGAVGLLVVAAAVRTTTSTTAMAMAASAPPMSRAPPRRETRGPRGRRARRASRPAVGRGSRRRPAAARRGVAALGRRRRRRALGGQLGQAVAGERLELAGDAVRPHAAGRRAVDEGAGGGGLVGILLAQQPVGDLVPALGGQAAPRPGRACRARRRRASAPRRRRGAAGPERSS